MREAWLSFTLEATYYVVQILVPKAFWQNVVALMSTVFVNDAILLGTRLTHVVQFFTGQWSPSWALCSYGVRKRRHLVRGTPYTCSPVLNRSVAFPFSHIFKLESYRNWNENSTFTFNPTHQPMNASHPISTHPIPSHPIPFQVAIDDFANQLIVFLSLFLADIMKSKGANTIIAVDVGSEYPAELTNYGDHLSGWWLLWKKWNPFSETVYVSTLVFFTRMELQG